MSKEDMRLSRRQFLQATPLGILGVTAGIGTLGGYGRFVEPQYLDVSQVRVEVPRLPKAFRNMTIALLTDLHIASSPGVQYLHSVVDRILEATPDLVALGGDYIATRDAEEPVVLRSLVARLRAPLGVYAILGNRDYADGKGSRPVMEALRQGGAIILNNSNVGIRRDGQTLYLAGVEDALEQNDDLLKALDRVPAGSCGVLLAHEPDFADEAAGDARVALQLSGHSHGGQVRLPGVPRILPRLGRKYPEGLRTVGSLQLYTSRGIGEVDIPIRINCPPELPIIRLVGG